MLLEDRSAATPPDAIAIPPSQDWDGNDGPWSSFSLRVGTPPRYVSVLASTSSYQTWTISPLGCTTQDPVQCPQWRGNVFNTSTSTTWRQENATAKGLFDLRLEENLGYNGNGLFGFDTVGLGREGMEGPTLDQQVVGSIGTPQYWFGLFGLDPRSSNFSDYDNPAPSFLGTLFNRSQIPSLSWGYTAGNQYRGQQILGSLTLGGFDSSRFVPNSVSFPFNEVDKRALSVTISGLEYQSSNGSLALMDASDNFEALIDSTVASFYLPIQICRQFEQAFGITWNDTVQGYPINDTLHSALQSQNATVTFSLASATSTENLDISLPYSAFDLIASYPLMKQPTRYFPLMRAANASQYTLGRAFLQETFVERSTEASLY